MDVHDFTESGEVFCVTTVFISIVDSRHVGLIFVLKIGCG